MQILVGAAGLQVTQRGVPRVRGQLALLDQAIELLLDLADAGLREVERGVDHDDVEPDLGGDLGDALPHLPGTDDPQLGDLGHDQARSTSNAMPSPPPMQSDAPPVFAPRAAIA